MTKALVWFRSDLRTQDNPALTAACNDHDSVVALFLITEDTWLRHHKAAAQVEWILQNLQYLSESLEKLNIALVVESVGTFKKSVSFIESFVKEHKIDQVYFNEQFEVDEQSRDRAVSENCDVQSFLDQSILKPNVILNKSGEPYKVFTPFKKAWLAYVDAQIDLEIFSKPKKCKEMFLRPSKVPQALPDFKSDADISYLKAGESAAVSRLKKYIENKVDDYNDLRDFPGVEATSMMSPYLAIGVLSVKQCIYYLLLKINKSRPGLVNPKSGAGVWLSELIWREFYRYILFHFPQVCRNQPFKPETDRLPWRNDKALLEAWKQGRTGFPLVDAAMRQLNQTGWMHNRVRMVVAMFFTKTLFLDWRLGEAYFMERLVDSDFASNNGGWQWSASTGTDAAPYFRIFNPLSQSERFDAEGDFIRQYCPELKGLDNKTIHAPHSRGAVDVDYPEPVEDYSLMRQKVIEAFKNL